MSHAGRWMPGEDRGGDPQPGTYAVKLCKGGPFMPGRILHDESGWWAAIGRRPHGRPTKDPQSNEWVMRIWTGGQRIEQGGFDQLLETLDYARKHMPHHPMLTPYSPVDVAALPPVIP